MMDFIEGADEVNAAVLQFRRSQRKNVLKFWSMMVLVFILVFGILALTNYVPHSVYKHFGVKYESYRESSAVDGTHKKVEDFAKRTDKSIKRAIRNARKKIVHVGHEISESVGIGSKRN